MYCLQFNSSFNMRLHDVQGPAWAGLSVQESGAETRILLEFLLMTSNDYGIEPTRSARPFCLAFCLLGMCRMILSTCRERHMSPCKDWFGFIFFISNSLDFTSESRLRSHYAINSACDKLSQEIFLVRVEELRTTRNENQMIVTSHPTSHATRQML